jgi:THO complex subunit 5
MRQVMRSGQVLLNAARHGAAEAREGLDRVDVELRGVEYERERVREEIALCGDYA